ITLSLSLTLIILSKELTLLDKLYFSVLASCTVNSLFNELPNPLSRTRFSNGAAKVGIILKLPNFFSKIFEILFSCQLFKELLPFRHTRFSKGVQRYDFLINLQIFLYFSAPKIY
ncbi:MAG: hypothetical protein J6A91_00900, partial [Bacteroidales bacterium]|nr:hypothetical protein [Bacteroidales bacterium]